MTPHYDMIDIHSHLLPGLDDGQVTMEESLHMCELYAQQGVSAVVATPHVGHTHHCATPDQVRRAVAALLRACRTLGLELDILPGADVRVQPDLMGLFDAGELLTVADAGRYLLLELPPGAAPRIEGLVGELLERGITPILTHPERNPDLVRRPDRLAGLVACGCLMQVTAGSVLGAFGSSARRAAASFLKAGLVHAVASDAHGAIGRRSPDLARVRPSLARLVGAERAAALLCSGPSDIVYGPSPAPCSLDPSELPA